VAEEKQRGAMMQSAVREEILFTIQVDKTAFDMMYETSMLMLDSLTPHQAKALKECMRDRRSAGCARRMWRCT
jgi:Spy/CpxP family protein refolding chaperone